MILGILGAGGLGREVYIVAKKINAAEGRWSEIIFMDDNRMIIEVLGIKCYGVEEAMQSISDLEVAVAIGEPRIREKVCNVVHASGKKLATLIHPGVYIDDTTTIGEGCVICEGATITSYVNIGENTYVQPHAVIGHDIKIGKHSIIGANVQIGGNNNIGSRVFIGFMAGTIQGLTIGDDVEISAGSIVFRNIEAGMIVMGNPARVIRRNEGQGIFTKKENNILR